jgi:EmrB/QacA subfamily drug resistance transporter
VLVALCAGFFMTLLDTTVVGVSIPNIVADLGVSYSEVLWVSNAYVLMLAVLLIPCGRLGDLLGRRNVFLTGVAVFACASLACALSQDAAELIAARSVQGLGGALLMPQTMAIIMRFFAPDRRGSALGVWAAVAGLATIAGPPLGGFLVSALGWRAIFLVNVPLGVLVLVAAPLIIPADPIPPRSGRFDLRGTVLVTGGVFCLAFGLQEGQRYDWSTVWSFVSIPLLLAIGVILLIAFVVSQRVPGDRTPVVGFALLANRNFALMNVAAIALSVGIMSMAIGFQLYAQSVLGFSALAAGLASAPMSAASVLLGPHMGKLSGRLGGKIIVVTGLTLFALGLLVFTVTTDTHTTEWELLPSMLLMGLGLGCTFAPLTTTAMRDVAPMTAGSAAGVLNATRQIGAVLGTAGFGVLLQNRLADTLNTLAQTAAASLPPHRRGDFVAGLRRATGKGIDYAELQAGTAVPIPKGTSPVAAEHIAATARHVFGDAFITAMHTSMILPIAVILIGAATAAAAAHRPVDAPEHPSQPQLSGDTATTADV